jgi:hypothetical protein
VKTCLLHSSSLRSLCTLLPAFFLFLIPVLQSHAQTVLEDGAIAFPAPDTESICTLEPGHYDANYFYRPDFGDELSRSTAQTADIQWTFVSECGSQWPAAAQAAMEFAGQLWSMHLESSVPIRIEATWANLPAATLGSAGPTRVIQLPEFSPNTWYAIAQASAMTGTDYVAQIADEEFDIVINMNCNRNNWYFGTDANPGTGQFDFVTVALHEIGHGVGFFGGIQVNTSQQTAGFSIQGLPIIYDRFNTDGNGIELTDSGNYPNNSNALFQAVTGARGGVFFTGENALSVNAGQDIPLFTPSTWNPGSSYSHLDQVTFTNTPNALMRPQVAQNFAVHSPGPVFCGMLGDWGWPLGESCREFLDRDAVISLNTMEIDFGIANVGSPREQTLTIANLQIAQENLEYSVVLEGDLSFEIVNPNSGQQRNIIIRYDPLDSDFHEGAIILSHNADNESDPIQIPLSGTALPENRDAIVEQNYPNPFSQLTTIPYAISRSGRVTIDVYNIHGQRIRTLVDEVRSAGLHEVVLDGTGLSSGVYLYRMIAGDFTETRKLMILN